MITIMIIGVLASLILGVASVAGETARESHSRHMVTRLHSLLTEYLDTFKTRRVKLNQNVETAIINAFASAGSGGAARRGQALAEARLYALREMMVMDVPDRWSDVLLQRIPSSPSITDGLAPLYLDQRTPMAAVYLRRYYRLVGRDNSLTGAMNTDEDIAANEGAECLYMVITLACGDGEARTLFHESNIGDTDGDGAPEFLDGWGHPIDFLRWAPGFDSDVQLNANLLADLPSTDAQQRIRADHDPYDLFRAESNAFRLVPLIYSAGRDEVSGIFRGDESYVPWRKTTSPGVSLNSPYLSPRLTPYELTPSNSDLSDYPGVANADGTATDNIHNHLLGRAGRTQ